MTTYKLAKPMMEGDAPSCVIKDGIMAIPMNPANTDYQQYLAWLEAGNQPEPADENA